MELSQIISLGEGYHQQFKESIDKSLVREICAFANAAGGVIFIGVTNKNEIATAKRTKVILELIANNPNISTSELAIKLEVSKRTILRDIYTLKQQNKLERIGAEKTGYWKIND